MSDKSKNTVLQYVWIEQLSPSRNDMLKLVLQGRNTKGNLVNITATIDEYVIMELNRKCRKILKQKIKNAQDVLQNFEQSATISYE